MRKFKRLTIIISIIRAFSKYKSMLTDKRQNLKFENLKRMFILLCNSEHEIDSDAKLD